MARLNIDELRVIAHFELLTNDTISQYEMVNGKPVSTPIFIEREWRWPAV